MASQNRITKLILAGLLITALTTATAAASIETAGGNDIVWQNSDWNVDEVRAQCSDSITNVEVNGTDVYSESENVTVLTTSDINDKIDLSAPSTLEVIVSCNDDTSDSLNLDVANFGLNLEENGDGVGFVGEIMKNRSGSLGNKRGLHFDSDIKSRNFSLEDLDGPNFSFNTLLNLESGSVTFTDTGVRLYPTMTRYPEDDIYLNVTDSATGLSYTKKVFDQQEGDSNDIFVHEWKANRVGDSNPRRSMSYAQVEEGEFEYFLDMKYRDRSSLPESDLLGDSNFRLTVKEQTDSGNYVLPEDSDASCDEAEYCRMEILEQAEPGSNSDANYRVSLDDYSKLDALKAGNYKFTLEVVYSTERPEVGEKQFTIDETWVEKSTVFSGIVLNAGQSGVKTLMEMSYGDTKRTVVSEDDGQYSARISEETFDSMSLDFYDTTKDTGNAPDAQLDLSEVTLDNPDLGPGSSAINFNYWNDPETEIDGLRPVNMMAIKFGYPVGSVTGLDMKFDSGELDPKDMKVYECDAWNFQGQECMSSWDSLDVSSDDIDFASWRVNLGNVSLYDAGEEDILMSSYVVGTSSKISLQDSISLESSSIKHSGELGASGVLVSENGDRVGDASVTLSLVQGDEVVKSWTQTSDGTGTFEFSETVDVEAGNYQLRVEAFESPFESFEMTSEKTLEVFYENGVSLDAPTSVDVVQGNESSFDLEVSNTGQQSIENIDLEVSGLEDQFYTISSGLDTLSSGDSESVEIVLDVPGDYCNLPCGNPPQLDFSVTGESGEEDVSDSLMTSIVLSGEASGDQSSESSGRQDESSVGSSSETDDSGSSGSPVEGVREMTGDFVEKQGELNIALGLIFIFTMMLALSVKKKKSGGSDRRGLDDGRGGGRPSLDRPPINSGEVHEVKAKETESGKEAEAASEEESRSEESEETEESEGSVDSGEGFECSVCGEEFESESGRDLHEEAVH